MEIKRRLRWVFLMLLYILMGLVKILMVIGGFGATLNVLLASVVFLSIRIIIIVSY